LTKHKSRNGVLRRVIERYGLPLRELTVLAMQSDPYRFDVEARHVEGRWVRTQLDRFYPGRTTHWRGLLYAIIMSKRKIRKPDGQFFQNSDDDWVWLQRAGKAARWLGHVPFDRIVDRRNAEPIIHRRDREVPKRFICVGLNVEIPDADDIDPTPRADGFTLRQAFHFVIFGEKSSLEEVLLPIAEREQADLYLGPGEISDTLIWRIAKDADEDGRPLVIFTVSDCDPSGHQMPVSIARKLQALHDLLFPRLRFEVVPVALTPEQVQRYDLPEEPLKESEKRAARWRETFGIEQTEVDALTTPEMIERGALAEIMREAFDHYVDRTLESRVNDAQDKWLEDAQDAIDEQVDHDEIDSIREDVRSLQDEVERINERLDAATDNIRLPSINVPTSNIDRDSLDTLRQALLKFGDDWLTATRKLQAHKKYESEE
jgi:hypothetical protein